MYLFFDEMHLSSAIVSFNFSTSEEVIKLLSLMNNLTLNASQSPVFTDLLKLIGYADAFKEKIILRSHRHISESGSEIKLDFSSSFPGRYKWLRRVAR